jgi:hypothetical protein
MDRPTSAWSALCNRTWPLNSSNLEYDLNEQWGQVTACLLNPLVARSGFLPGFGSGCEHKGKLTSDSPFPTLIISTSQQNLRAPWQSPLPPRARPVVVRKAKKDHPWRQPYQTMRTPIPNEQIRAPLVGMRTYASP